MLSIHRLGFVIMVLGLMSLQIYAKELETSFSYAGHGALFDKSRTQIKITREFIQHAQSNLLKKAENQSTREAKYRYAEIREKLHGFEMDDFHRAYTNAGLIQLLSEGAENKRSTGLSLLEENAGLKSQIRHAFGSPLHWKRNTLKAFDASIIRLWTEVNLIDYIIIDLAHLLSNDYIRSCREEGVPVPTFFGGSGWTKSAFDADGPGGALLEGELVNEFILEGSKSIVWGWESNNPRGSCIALPRGNGVSASTVGVICQANDSPKACFFDNVNDDGSKFTVTEGDVIAMNRFATGPQLVAMGGPTGKCAACHRGENAFIIHPGTALDLTAQGFNLQSSSGWYEPLFGPNPGEGWVNPPRSTALDTVGLGTTTVYIPFVPGFNITANVADRGCNSCHQLPELQPADSFCGSSWSAGFLQLASERTMPPPTEPPANWDSMQSLHDVAFEKHINALRAECGQSPSSSNPTFDWLLFPEN
ncbi:MAG: hypothetical protein AB8B87_14075 [Granulosicoccus sp.]